MTKSWIVLLNFFSNVEFRIADKLGEVTATLFHFFLFWVLPALLIYIPAKPFAAAGIVLAAFYIYILVGDILFSVFGHDKMEKKRGMLDIANIQEMKQEIFGALVKYVGGIVSFATIFNAMQILSGGKAFLIPVASPLPYFDLFYFSIITITTVGYGDIQPVLWWSRSVTILEIVFGMGFVLLLFTMLLSTYMDIQKRKQ